MAKMSKMGSNVIFLQVRRDTDSIAPKQPHIQLELALNDDCQLFCISTGNMSRGRFLKTLATIGPRIIFDLRYAPHFNFPGIGPEFRSTIFHKLRIEYLNYSIAFHDVRRNLFKMNFSATADDLISKLGRDKINGPIILLFETDSESALFAPYVLGALLRRDQRTWTVHPSSQL